MGKTSQMNYSPASSVGFWSATAALVEVVVFAVAMLIPEALQVTFVASFLLVPTFVALMVAIHYSTPAEKRIWSHLGLSFAIIYAVLCSLNYYIQLTVVRNNSLGISQDTLRLFAFVPGSAMFSQDMLGYAFMCLSTLAAAPVFGGDRLSRWIRVLFIVHGMAAFQTLIFPALPFEQDPASVAATNQSGVLALLFWSVLFSTIAVLLAVRFRRLQRQAVPVDSVLPGARAATVD